MTQRSSIAKIIAVTSSLTLFGAYVWHSHITPNTPPPDPLGLSTIEGKSEPETIEFDGFVDYRDPNTFLLDSPRVIGSKAINQPIFSVSTGAQSAAATMLSSGKSSLMRLPSPSLSNNGETATSTPSRPTTPPAPPP